jgi:hypothetical protein
LLIIMADLFLSLPHVNILKPLGNPATLFSMCTVPAQRRYLCYIVVGSGSSLQWPTLSAVGLIVSILCEFYVFPFEFYSVCCS